MSGEDVYVNQHVHRFSHLVLRWHISPTDTGSELLTFRSRILGFCPLFVVHLSMLTFLFLLGLIYTPVTTDSYTVYSAFH